jgi:hypothetical protein
MALLCAARLAAAESMPPTQIEVTIEPQKFGDVGSILKVDSTVASFKFDKPVEQLAMVVEAYPKEKRLVPVARLALELTKPTAEGRLCVQMADQGFIPLGNGAPHQMQLFLQVDCGGTVVSSSQSFLKEKFNFSKSLARPGAGTQMRLITSHRVPVFWLMGNSDTGTYLTDEALDKLIAKNANDAYVLVAYLEFAKENVSSAPVLATSKPTPGETVKPAVPPSGSGSATSVVATVPSSAVASSVNATKAVEGSSTKSASKAKPSNSTKSKTSSSSAKTRKRSS